MGGKTTNRSKTGMVKKLTTLNHPWFGSVNRYSYPEARRIGAKAKQTLLQISIVGNGKKLISFIYNNARKINILSHNKSLFHLFQE